MNKLIATAIALGLATASVAAVAQDKKQFDPYSQGAKAGQKFDTYSEGAKSGTSSTRIRRARTRARVPT
jgi:hypothetical protein